MLKQQRPERGAALDPKQDYGLLEIRGSGPEPHPGYHLHSIKKPVRHNEE